jgi:acetoin utilization deacetylase AcuC-like enzyme
MGFCLLANIALAIEAAKAKHGIERIAVVDWDVHHGNGTQSIFFERSDVLTISMHQEGCFPPGYSGGDDIGKGQGEGYNINVPLLPGGGHEVYEYAMKRVVMPALNRYKPELIIVASGYDAGGFDPLGRMLLHSDSYRMLTETIMSAADIHTNGKLVLVHEGGYAESNVPFCVHAAIETLAQKNTDVIDPSLVMIEAWQPNSRVLALQKEMLDEIGMFHKL